MSTRLATFGAICHPQPGTTPDDVLAEALGVIDQHCPVAEHQVREVRPGIVLLRIAFWVANDAEASAKARETAVALSQRWPTDAVTLDGNHPEPSGKCCPDCGGALRRAFSTTDHYLSCRRCGHVFPNQEN